MNSLTSKFKEAKIAICLALAVSVLAGCSLSVNKTEAAGPASQSTGLVPPQARITDERILGDRKNLEAAQQRLRKLSEAGVPQNSYPLAKAQ